MQARCRFRSHLGQVSISYNKHKVVLTSDAESGASILTWTVDPDMALRYTDGTRIEFSQNIITIATLSQQTNSRLVTQCLQGVATNNNSHHNIQCNLRTFIACPDDLPTLCDTTDMCQTRVRTGNGGKKCGWVPCIRME
eukprot:4683970-Prymnesium_polylepis.1